MSLLSQQYQADLRGRPRDAPALTTGLMSEVIEKTCRRFSTAGQIKQAARIERLIQSAAWTDTALALIELELPQWQVRRLAYDEGEWHCALSRERELPDWLDQATETHHSDLALAILSAFVEAQRSSVPSSRTSVPAMAQDEQPFYHRMSCDNFA